MPRRTGKIYGHEKRLRTLNLSIAQDDWSLVMPRRIGAPKVARPWPLPSPRFPARLRAPPPPPAPPARLRGGLTEVAGEAAAALPPLERSRPCAARFRLAGLA